jgi:hypothetical protein
MEVSSVDDDAGQQECGAAQATLPAEFGEGAGLVGEHRDARTYEARRCVSYFA